MDEPATLPEKPRVPWGIVTALVVVVGLYFVSQLIAAVVLSLHPNAQDWLTNSVYGQFIFILLVEALTIGGLLIFLKMYKFSVQGLGFKKPRWKDFGWGVLVYPVYFMLFAAMSILASRYVPGFNADQKQEIGFSNVAGTVPLVLTFISLVVLPPLTEELLVRGFLFTSLGKYLKFGGAAILTSLIFAAAHLPEGGAAGPLYIAALDTFILSMFLCRLREKTGSLWAGITLHALKNGVAYVSLFIIASR